MDILSWILSHMPLGIIAWVLATMALLSAVQVFLEFVAKQLDKDPASESAFEKFVALLGKGVGMLKVAIDWITANRQH